MANVQTALGNIHTWNVYFLTAMKVRDIIAMLEQDGWVLVAQRGSHRQYKHPSKPGKVTVSGHRPGDDVPPGLLNSIVRQAGLK
jgi:predicted RNA binding protein YcfA (HicA-like mRNA interferase family)